jgi:hypothetical protein
MRPASFSRAHDSNPQACDLCLLSAEGVFVMVKNLPAPLDARAIKASLDLAELAAGRYGLRLHRAGRQYVSLCCFHSERHPSLYIDRSRFYCFGCRVGGDSFAFIMRREPCGFPVALRVAADFLRSSPAHSERGRRFLPAERARRPVCGRRSFIARQTEPQPRSFSPLNRWPSLEPDGGCAAEREFFGAMSRG